MLEIMQRTEEYFRAKNIIFEEIDVEEGNFIRVPYNLSDVNAKLDVIVIFGKNNKDISLKIFNIYKVPEEKKMKAHELCSKLNEHWRWVKFYVSEDNQLTAEDDGVVDVETVGEETFELIGHMVSIVENAYPEIMKLIWGGNSEVSAPRKN